MDNFEVRLEITEAQRSSKHVSQFSDLYNHPGESVSMNSEILTAMRAGNKEFMEKMKSYKTPMVCFKNDQGETILHLVAAFGHLELVKSIVFECPSLLLEPNWKGQLPLHTAAHAGHLDVINALVGSVTFLSDKLAKENMERLNPYALKDVDGNTPLHLALKEIQGKQKVMYWLSVYDESTRLVKPAACLVSANQDVSFLANKNEISPLYLAVEAGNLLLVNAMLNNLGNNLATQLEGRKSLVHAALKGKNTDVLDIILQKYPSLVKERDEEGRTCLSVGVSVGFYKGICKLLDTSTSIIFDCDDDGSFPIHIAVEKGHKNIVKEFQKRCPDSIHQLNKKGQNIFHIAVKSCKTTLSFRRYINKTISNKHHLLEEQDIDGNTPLHLATINWRPKAIRTITRSISTRTKVLGIKNLLGLRPLDIAEIHLQSNYVFRERMTLMVLLSLYNQRLKGVSLVPTSGMTLRNRSEKLGGGGGKKYKDRVNILLLVATLVTTMTFAAGFTMPGGFGSSSPNAGMAILVDDRNLSIFIIYDTIAMLASVVAIVALIWAQLGDQELTHKAFNLALPALFVALGLMVSAFLAGILSTIQHNIKLKNTVDCVGRIFFAVITFLLAPYVIPQVYGVPVIQTVTKFYLLFLVLFVNEDDSEKHNTTCSCHTCGNKVEIMGSSSGDDQVKRLKVL